MSPETPDSDYRSTTFDIDGDVEGSSFEGIDSTADKLLKAGSLKNSRWKRILHEPTRRDNGEVNWTKIGALAGVVSAFIALTALLVTILIA
jgi:hypothetical protein